MDGSMESLGLGGFVLLLAGWFGMFARVRRDHPGHPLANYSTYVSFGRRSGFSLLPFYWRHYGLDVWFAVSMIGIALIAGAIVMPPGTDPR
jgi:hypothetical protein